jgi:signal transduction histidine kinase
MKFTRSLLIVLAMVFSLLSQAQTHVLDRDTPDQQRLQNAAVLEDTTGQLTLEDVRSPALASRFQTWEAERGEINLGFSQSAVWIRIPLQRTSDAPANWVLELPFFQLRSVDFFAPNQPPVRTGNALDISTRPFLYSFYAFPVQISTDSEAFYLRVTSDHSLTVPLSLWQEQPFRHHIQNKFILQALYFGGLIALLIYNLFLWLSLKDLRFLLYSLFVGHFGLAMLAGNGLGQLFLWPGKTAFDGIAQSVFLSLVGCFSMLFADRFLRARQHLPWASRGLMLFASFYLLMAMALLSTLWHGQFKEWLLMGLFMVVLPTGGWVAVAGTMIVRRGEKGARFFLLAWLVLWSGAGIAALRAFDLLPTNTFTSYSLQISSAIEMLLLALALADMVHVERKNREAAQQQAIEANQRLLESARLAEERLEGAVQERTEQLKLALSSETQLLSQYMRFGALISHEFRNPLGIVNSQISLIRKEHELGQLNLDKRLQTIDSATRRLLSLFETWLRGDRLQQAMQDMKPQHLPLAAWLRELIDDQTSYHANHRLELKINRVVGDLWADENLLEVAVLNLIDNACKYSNAGTKVLVETLQKPGWVGICVSDEGQGIDTVHHEAVFEDYFRVASESTISGMGLGLAFVRRIVQMHHGKLELQSAVGQGSRFCLWLPHQNQ